jgi:DNA polymerase V
MKSYIAIDLKSFYASVECVERGLDPLTANLVVADESRTNKTICLAVSPSLKAYGIPGRPRLFEVEQRVKEVNRKQPGLNLNYIVAPPRMAYYIDYSTRIYEIYLHYVAPEDIFAYSIDEVFIDATAYLDSYKITAHELALRMVRDVLRQTGITATAGIGTNMYLCKVAMDIMAKHTAADKDGVRIAELDEMNYRQQLWNHKPLTDFWRIGRGIARRLEPYGIDTMGRIARCSIENEELLYHLFGVNAELLIDHAWGWEPCTLKEAKSYKPENNSLSSGQVLSSAYTFKKALVVIREMADEMALRLVKHHLVADQLVVTVSYDTSSLTDPTIKTKYEGPVTTDYYGRPAPKHAHGSVSLGQFTSSSKLIIKAAAQLFKEIVNPDLLIKRLNVTANHVISEYDAPAFTVEQGQLDLFADYEALAEAQKKAQAKLKKERRMQEAVLGIKEKFGKNAILRGLNFEEGATAKDRNQQIGGHKA